MGWFRGMGWGGVARRWGRGRWCEGVGSGGGRGGGFCYGPSSFLFLLLLLLLSTVVAVGLVPGGVVVLGGLHDRGSGLVSWLSLRGAVSDPSLPNTWCGVWLCRPLRMSRPGALDSSRGSHCAVHLQTHPFPSYLLIPGFSSIDGLFLVILSPLRSSGSSALYATSTSTLL